MFNILISLLSFCFLFDNTMADQDYHENRIPLELLFGNPEKASPSLSPNGAYLAYLAPDHHNVMNVWVRNLQTAGEDTLITSDQKRGIRFYLWQYDNNHILYLQDIDGNENWHLYQANLQTKETRDITPFPGATASPIAYYPENPDEILVQINSRDLSVFDVYRINLKTGVIALEQQNHDNCFQWLADHNLNVRASAAFNKEGKTIVKVRDAAQGPWKELITWDPEEDGTLLSFSADNSSLYIVTNKNEPTGKLFKVDTANGSLQTIASDSSYDLLESIVKNPLTHELEAAAVYKEKLHWIFFDSQMESEFAALCEGIGEGQLVSRDLENNLWIVSVSSDTHPTQYYLYDRRTKQKQFLFSTQPDLEAYTLLPMTPVSFKARDGLKLHGYLTLPAKHDPKTLPAVLLVHGGPWLRDTWGFDSQVQWLANRGYAVLQVNFRGSTGYGKEHLNAGNREWGGAMHMDLLDSKQWLIDQGYADPDKIAIFGGSYGGYATLSALAFTPEEFCCGVDVVGPSNLVTLLQTIPPYWGPMKAIFTTRVGNIDLEKEFLESRSPLFQADKISKPLLIAHGANDPRVKQAESDQIVEAMRKNGKEVEYILFSDDGHGFGRPKNMINFCRAVEAFLNKQLSP